MKILFGYIVVLIFISPCINSAAAASSLPAAYRAFINNFPDTPALQMIHTKPLAELPTKVTKWVKAREMRAAVDDGYFEKQENAFLFLSSLCEQYATDVTTRAALTPYQMVRILKEVNLYQYLSPTRIVPPSRAELARGKYCRDTIYHGIAADDAVNAVEMLHAVMLADKNAERDVCMSLLTSLLYYYKEELPGSEALKITYSYLLTHLPAKTRALIAPQIRKNKELRETIMSLCPDVYAALPSEAPASSAPHAADSSSAAHAGAGGSSSSDPDPE